MDNMIRHRAAVQSIKFPLPDAARSGGPNASRGPVLAAGRWRVSTKLTKFTAPDMGLSRLV